MKIYLEWLEIPCIGIYSGLFGSNLVFGNWMHEKYFLSVQVFGWQGWVASIRVA
jgi:hypothetical protein